MEIRLFFLYCIALMLSGCSTQNSAPIEYNHDKDFSKKSVEIASSSSIYHNTKSQDRLVASDEAEIIHREISEEEKDFDSPTGFLKERVATQKQSRDDIITVPKIKQDNRKVIYHEVHSGETLASIANDYGQTVEELAELNKLSAPYSLEESQIITIKVSGELLNKKNQEHAIKKIDDSSQTNKFIKPVDGKIIIKFGEQTPKGKSRGINITADKGTSVKSIAAGKVVFVGNDARFGNLLIIKLNSSDLYVAYAHLQDLIVPQGTTVAQGEVIGQVGSTGDVSFPQLHFAIRQGKVAVDPLIYLNYKAV